MQTLQKGAEFYFTINRLKHYEKCLSALTMAQEVIIENLLAEKTVVIVDGGLATELEARGLDLSSALWSARILQDNPNVIRDVHRDYYRAGADIAITASYQASPQGMQDHLRLTASQSRDLIKRSVRLAQEARDKVLVESRSTGQPQRQLLVAGSIGPYGAYLSNGAEYTGDYSISADEMTDFHRARMQALIEAGVDVLACETMPSLPEIRVLLDLLAREHPSGRAWITCTLRDPSHLADGHSIAEVIHLVESSNQVVAFGFNCIPEQDVSSALESARALTSLPLIVYPNSGEVWNAKTRSWEGTRVGGQTLADLAREWNRKGARLIGGCCRTTPADIAVLKQAFSAEGSPRLVVS